MIVERAIELGINFFDTANPHSWDDSERVLGDYDRDWTVVATNVYNASTADPRVNETGLSRKTIEQELEDSLDRLDGHDRPVSDPPLGLRDANRGDDARTRRHGPAQPGALPGRLLHVGPPVPVRILGHD